MCVHVFVSVCVCVFRWLYQLLAYFLFFFNVIFGVVMCFLRILGVVVFTLVMLCRLDWDVYMRGLEGWDIGTQTHLLFWRKSM